jgi:DNA polymerase-3 subunit alpha
MNKNKMKANRLFNEPIPEFHLPQLQHHPLDDALDEMELLGFEMCNPFELVEDDVVRNMVREGTTMATE